VNCLHAYEGMCQAFVLVYPYYPSPPPTGFRRDAGSCRPWFSLGYLPPPPDLLIEFSNPQLLASIEVQKRGFNAGRPLPVPSLIPYFFPANQRNSEKIRSRVPPRFLLYARQIGWAFFFFPTAPFLSLTLILRSSSLLLRAS